MEEYRTPHTALAAYLLTEGFSLLEVATEPHPYKQHNGDAVFVFEANPQLLSCSRKWQIGKAEGNLSIFYDNYRKLVKRAKVAVKVAGL